MTGNVYANRTIMDCEKEVDKYIPSDFLKGKKRGKKSKVYLEEIVTLDTETSHTPFSYDKNGKLIKQGLCGWIYQWGICTSTNILSGRTPYSLCEVLEKMTKKAIELKQHLIIWVHNLSYDMEYLIRYLSNTFGEPTNSICLNTHQLINVQWEDSNLEFRCSYRLTNDNLQSLTNKYKVEHKKLSGYVDYNATHYQDSLLSDDDWLYLYNDIVGLYEVIQAQLNAYGNNLNNVPLTSTGYIRKMMLNSFKSYNKSNKNSALWHFRKCEYDIKCYFALRFAFAGGLTHGNRHKANVINSTNSIYPYIKHRDYDSFYPTMQICKYFPMSKWLLYYEDNGYPLKEELFRQKLDTMCCLIYVRITDLCLKDNRISLPYAQSSKFVKGKVGRLSIIEDNGRILKFNGSSDIWCTELDFELLERYYDFDYQVIMLYTSHRGQLPEWFISVVNDLYKKKCDYKARVKEIEKEIEMNDTKELRDALYKAEIELLKSKQLLNSIYGMSATDIVRADFQLNGDGDYRVEQEITEDYIKESLSKYYSSYNKCLQYGWGIYTTNWARYELMTVYDIITEDDYNAFLYADTDSMFYYSNDKIEKRLAQYNADLLQNSIDNDYYVTLNNGQKKYFQSFEEEHEEIIDFKFLHAKCYGINSKIYGLKCTIAGVPKRTMLCKDSYITREEELGNLENLQDEFTFKKCGGSAITYINSEIIDTNINGHPTTLANAGIIYSTTKTLSELDIYHI